MAEHVCPWWMGYVLISPLRRLLQNPRKILDSHVKPGMITLDVGCGMGYFSLAMAETVGPEGKVVCVDLQPKMIEALKRRASKAGVLDRIDHRVCDKNGLGLDDLGERSISPWPSRSCTRCPMRKCSSNRFMRRCGKGGHACSPSPRGMFREALRGDDRHCAAGRLRRRRQA